MYSLFRYLNWSSNVFTRNLPTDANDSQAASQNICMHLFGKCLFDIEAFNINLSILKGLCMILCIRVLTPVLKVFKGS